MHPITSVDITVDTPLGKTAYTATFTNSKSLSCSALGSTLTCTGSITESGDYSLTGITEETGTETFDVSEFTTTLTIKKNPIMDTNSKVVKIDSNNPTFKIYLYSTNYFPDLYSSPTDPSQTISCVQQNAYLECTPNDSMKRNGDYPIYYKDRCNGIQPTGITVKVSRKIEVSPVALSFDNGSRCLMNPPSSVTVIISFSEEMYGTFWD